MKAEVILGDCIEVMRGMEPNSIDAVVTDPPYGLEFMGKGWDTFRPASAHADARRRRADELDDPVKARYLRHNVNEYVAGKPYQVWCYGWAVEALRVLKPGGYLLAFGGTRTHHRLMVAIEDAGFEIRDCLMWLYGSGFPKSYNLHGEWEGWGTALKPAYEPIILARKPLSEPNVAANVLKWATGALNIDGCRIPGTVPLREDRGVNSRSMFGNHSRHAAGHGSGRWPAHVLLDEEAAAMLDAMTGDTSVTGRRSEQSKNATVTGTRIGPSNHRSKEYPGDRGGASRFFYVAKTSKSERGEYNTHPTVKPIALMRYLIRLVTPPGGLVLDPFAGSGSTLIAAMQEGFRAIGIEKEPEYVEIAKRRIAETAGLSAEASANVG